MLLIVPTIYEASFLFSDSVVDRLRETGFVVSSNTPFICIAICGVGLVGSAIGSLKAIDLYQQELSPDFDLQNCEIVLIGIAGSYDIKEFPVESVIVADKVHCLGHGIPSDDTVDLTKMSDMDMLHESGFEGRYIDCKTHIGESWNTHSVVSVATPAKDNEEAITRQKSFPFCAVEEMEAYSVCIAALQKAIPITVIRGISNEAGMRDKKLWSMKSALRSACNVFNIIFRTDLSELRLHKA